jgi:hypothetical protein
MSIEIITKRLDVMQKEIHQGLSIVNREFDEFEQVIEHIMKALKIFDVRITELETLAKTANAPKPIREDDTGKEL